MRIGSYLVGGYTDLCIGRTSQSLSFNHLTQSMMTMNFCKTHTSDADENQGPLHGWNTYRLSLGMVSTTLATFAF